MTNVFQAELMKLTSRRSLLITAVLVSVAAVVASFVVFGTASEGSELPNGRGTTIAALSEAGGATAAFALGASFTGFFAFVVFTALAASEFSQGTFRTMLMRQPRRAQLLLGKMAGLISYVAIMLVAAAALTVVLSLVIAPTQDVSTGDWFTLAGAGEALADYGIVLFVASSWAVYAMALAVLVRSIPLALGIGIAWAGPFEHLSVEALSGAVQWYPGLLLEAVAAGGTEDVSLERAMLTTAVYVVLATAGAVALFTRRDVKL